jgi:NAD(P)-dependent dehydrogenase (short-subunit alcohol dehydrogenase family)
MMDLNLKSAFLCTREALKIMSRKGSGRIVNISAMAGLNPSAGRGAYCISKASVATLTRITAEEVKGTGITVNALAPSIIVTEANVRSSPGEDYSKWVKPEEVAELILYLCSEPARSINGAVIEVKGAFN